MDLTDRRVVEQKQAQEWAETNGLEYCEISVVSYLIGCRWIIHFQDKDVLECCLVSFGLLPATDVQSSSSLPPPFFKKKFFVFFTERDGKLWSPFSHCGKFLPPIIQREGGNLSHTCVSLLSTFPFLSLEIIKCLTVKRLSSMRHYHCLVNILLQ